MAALKHARDPGLWDRLVNERFGSAQPVLSGQESIAAAKKLWRHATGKSFPGDVVLTSGNRYTWRRTATIRGRRRQVLFVNPDKQQSRVRGLRALIHDISHLAHRQMHPRDSAHSARQARLEARLVTFALERGFVDGALKREPPPAKPKPSLIQQRHARMVARRDKWASEAERATRLLAKAERELRAYERRNAEKIAAPPVAKASRKAEDAPKVRAAPGAKVKALAALHGVEIERHTDLDSRPWYVSHPDLLDTEADPHVDDHYAHTWPDVLERVQEIIAALEKRAA